MSHPLEHGQNEEMIIGENFHWGRDDMKGMTIDASIIGKRDLHEMDNLDDCEFVNDESNDEDNNEVEYNDDE
nr:hypothetical protein CFP56_12845 [Quercus suber]